MLPRTGLNAHAAAWLLEDLVGRALGGEFEQVICLDAPEPVGLPGELILADGRGVYQPHGGVRYATRIQLAAEERLLAQAQARGAPALTREQAARALGTTAARLDAAYPARARHGDGRARPRRRLA